VEHGARSMDGAWGTAEVGARPVAELADVAVGGRRHRLAGLVRRRQPPLQLRRQRPPPGVRARRRQERVRGLRQPPHRRRRCRELRPSAA
jgi:hypothetical protein